MRTIGLLALVCALAPLVASAQVVVQGGAPPTGIPAGASIWYGTVAPANTVGANGDFYLDTTTYCLYGPKVAGVWPSSCGSSVSQLGYVAENLDNKGKAGGYAALDANQLLPTANLPSVAAINGTSVPINSTSDQTVVTTAPAVGAWTTLPACPDTGGNHLNYSLVTHGFLCGTTGGTAGSVQFGGVGTGTNANALLVTGTLGYSGGGLINANQLGGVSLASLPTGLLKITGGSGTPSVAAASDVTATLGFAPENTANRNAANGYAPLDSNGLLPAANLPAIAAINGTSVPGNSASDQTVVTTAPAVGAWTTLPACPDTGGNHLNYNVATHGFLCGNTGGTAGSVQFSGVGAGTNSNTLLISGSLGYSGAGLINANQLGGVTLAGLSTGLLKITGGAGVPSVAASSDLTATLGFTPENSMNKNAPNGYAPLDSSALLPAANLPASAVQTDAYGNMMPIAGSASFGAASSSPGCWYFGDANDVHTLTLCNPTSGYTGTVNLWATAGGAGQATTSDGAGNLGWSSLGGISGALTAAQFPSPFGLSSKWNLSWSPTAATSGSPTLFSLTGPAHTTLANAPLVDINLNLNRTVQFAGGGSSFAADGLVLSAPTYTAAAAQTIAGPATLVVSGPPTCAGSGLTCQTPKGLWVEGSAVSATGATVATAYAFEADLPSGATNNWAAYLNGATCIGLSCPLVASGNTLMVYNGTATTGVTTGIFHAGAGQSATPVLSVQNNSGTAVFNVDASGNVTASGTVNATQLNGTSLAGLTTGILKNTTGTGAPSIAAGKDLPAPAGGGPVGGVAALTANSTMINSSTEVSVISYTIPANTVSAGTTYRIKAWGTCTSSATNATNLLVRFGATGTSSDTAILTQTITAATSGSTVPFSLEYEVTFRSTSAAQVTGFLWNGGATGISTTAPNAPVPTGTSGLTTTSNEVLQFSGYGAASTTTITFLNATIELVKI